MANLKTKIEEALAQGISPDDIVSYLGESADLAAPIKAAVEQGVPAADILKYVSDFGSTSFQEGRQESNPVIRGMLNVIQGPTFGFGDELVGAVGGAYKAATGGGSFSDEYQKARDYARGVQQKYREDFPIGSVLTQAATAAPLMALGGPAATTAQQVVPRVVANVGRGTASGALSGAVGAAGQSEFDPTQAGFYKDVAKGGAFGGALGGVTQAAAPVYRTVKGAIAPRLGISPKQYAQEKVAESIVRGMPESPGMTPLTQAQAKMAAMGPEARLADVSRPSRSLLDVTATLPGKTGQAVEAAQRARIATESRRMLAGAEQAMGEKASLFQQTLDGLNTAREALAKPFYRAVDKAAVTIDDELYNLIQRTQEAHSKAEGLRLMATGVRPDISQLKPGDRVPLSILDTVKKSLDDIASAARRAGEGNTQSVAAKTASDLVEKLKAVSPKVGGKSAYAQALEQWAGPSKLMDAMEVGAASLQTPIKKLRQEMASMTAGELEAFRLGAVDALREKVGMQAGRTELINAWKNPTTSDQLKLLFGNDYRKFQKVLLQEEKLRAFQRVGAGAQTAERLAAKEDLGISAMENAAEMAAAVKTGVTSPGMIGTAANLLRKAGTPESVRNEIGRLLLSRDQQEIASLGQYLARLNEARRIASIRAGVGLGGAGGMAVTGMGQQ